MGQQTYTVIEQQQTFGTFLWNGRTKEFLGRDGTSWGKIFVFYVIFYLFLAGFMAAALALFYQTLSEDEPTYNPGDGTSILKNPALGYRPLPPKHRIESTLIWFNVNDNATYKDWTDSLDEFADTFAPEVKNNKTAFPNRVVKTCSEADKPSHEKHEVCDVDLKALGTQCTKANGWGYKEGNPCILLKMNKMMKWVPDLYKEEADLEGVSESAQKLITNKQNPYLPFIFVTCEGENMADREYMGEVKYLPQQGFPSYYYPYLNTKGYLSPIISVQFTGITRNVLINVECKVWAKNINHVRKTKLGIAHFEFLIDEKKNKKTEL